MHWSPDQVSERQFELFMGEAAGILLRAGYLMTGNAKDAEDLVQETFLQLARRWHRVRSMDHPSAYARRVLVNLVLREADRRSRRDAEMAGSGTGDDAADEFAARALRAVDDSSEFRWALARLPARQRAVLVLRYWADLTSTASRAASRLAQLLSCAEQHAGQAAAAVVKGRA